MNNQFSLKLYIKKISLKLSQADVHVSKKRL